jgi:hypothetical protein
MSITTINITMGDILDTMGAMTTIAILEMEIAIKEEILEEGVEEAPVEEDGVEVTSVEEEGVEVTPVEEAEVGVEVGVTPVEEEGVEGVEGVIKSW